MTVEIPDEIYQQLDSRFDILKEHARNGIALKSDFCADRVDRDYYHSLIALYDSRRKKLISNDEAMHEGTSYRTLYITDKFAQKRSMESYIELNRIAIASGQIRAKLNRRPIQMTQKEAVGQIMELIASITEDQKFSRDFRDILYFLITGTKNLTEDERYKLDVMYGIIEKPSREVEANA